MYAAKPTLGGHSAKCYDGDSKQITGIRDSRERPAFFKRKESET